jgi:diacylglycerol kinase
MKNSTKSEKFSLKQRAKSFRFAINGIVQVVKNEHNARVHVVALIFVIAFGVFFNIQPLEWVAITIVAGLVILTELLNTAVERLADFVEPQWNDNIGLIKDYCAGAVLISALVAVIVGAIIFVPKILLLF